MNLALCFRNRLCSSASCNCIRERDNKIVRAVEGEPARFVIVLCRILGLTRSRVKYLTRSLEQQVYEFFKLNSEMTPRLRLLRRRPPMFKININPIIVSFTSSLFALKSVWGQSSVTFRVKIKIVWYEQFKKGRGREGRRNQIPHIALT